MKRILPTGLTIILILAVAAPVIAGAKRGHQQLRQNRSYSGTMMQKRNQHQQQQTNRYQMQQPGDNGPGDQIRNQNRRQEKHPRQSAGKSDLT